ncbi:MAG: conjugal transfer protein TrbF [Rhodospirillaceae bacterium]
MLFKRAPQRYGFTPEPATPYQKAAQVWDERLGTLRAQSHTWQRVSVGLIVLTLILAGGSVWQASRSHIQPYVVEIDGNGAARAVAPAKAAYHPNDMVVARHLSDFIEKVRSLSIDPMVIRANWLDAYGAITQKAKPFLDDFAKSTNPFDRVGERSVAVQVSSVVKATDNTYQVKWSEQHYERSTLTSTEEWTAMLTLVTATPKTEAEVLKNPLGLYVNGIAWSRDITAAQR